MPFWALIAFTLVLILSPQSYVPAIGHLHLAFLTAAVAVLGYIYGQFMDRQALFPAGKSMVALLMLLIWAVATIPVSLWTGGSVDILFGIYLKAVIVFWLLGSVVNSVSRLWMAGWTLTVAAVPLATSAVAKLMSGGFKAEELSQGLDRISGYASALTSNPNDMALMLNLILPISIALLFISRRPVIRLLLGGIIVLCILAIVATYSRAGFLTLGITLLVYLLVLWKRGHRTVAFGLMGVMIASMPFLPSSYLTRLSTITDVQADATGSAQSRLQDMLAAGKYVLNHPVVGAGIGQDILALNDVRGETWVKVHNVYLEYAVDLGLPGLALFMTLLYLVMRDIYGVMARPAIDPQGEILRWLAQGIGVSLIGFMIGALFYPDAYQFYFYYIAGLAVAAKSIACRSRYGLHTSEQAITS